MSERPFDFEEARRRFPDHWDDDGWPARGSTWQATNYPPLRVRVAGRSYDSPFEEVEAMVYWDGDLESLHGLFTYEPDDRWSIGEHGLVTGPAGIDRERRWSREGDRLLVVNFARAMFGDPNTSHIHFGEQVPSFEPVDDWDES